MTTSVTRWLALAPLALAACVQQEVQTGPEAGALAFQEDCAACHGPDGKGLRFATMRTPDLTRLSERNGGTFPRDYVMSTIDGYIRGEHFSDAMPEFGAGDMGPTVIVEEDGIGTPIPARLLALANWLETVQE